MSKRKSTTTYLTPDQRARLAAEAQRRGCSQTQVVRDLVAGLPAAEEQERRDVR